MQYRLSLIHFGSNLHNEGIEGAGDSCILRCISGLGFAEPNALEQVQNVFFHLNPPCGRGRPRGLACVRLVITGY